MTLQLATWADLTSQRVEDLVPKGNNEFAHVWPGVLKAAHLFWAAQGSSRDSLEDTWSLLVFAAGNFKRPGGTQIQLLHTVPSEITDLVASDRPSVCTFPLHGGVVRIARDDADTWRRLTDIKGIKVATATTILSALWPDNHLIADVRDISVAIALNWEQRDDDWLLPLKYPQAATWNWYSWLRDLVIQKAVELGLSMATVERSLYFLDKNTRTTDKPEWSLYVERISRNLLAMEA